MLILLVSTQLPEDEVIVLSFCNWFLVVTYPFVQASCVFKPVHLNSERVLFFLCVLPLSWPPSTQERDTACRRERERESKREDRVREAERVRKGKSGREKGREREGER